MLDAKRLKCNHVQTTVLAACCLFESEKKQLTSLKMSDPALSTDSEPDPLSPIGSQDPVDELRASSGSDTESEVEGGGSR